MEVLIYTDRDGNDVGALLDFDLDVSWGETEQDFTLITNTKIEPGAYVYQDGTEIGGVIDSYTTSTETDLRTYKGRSWHGILSYKVLEPDAGNDHLVFSGDLNSIIDQMIRRAGLTSIFKASSQHARVSITWKCERYTNLYYELKKLMRSCACKLMMKHADGMVELYAEDVNVISDEVDSDVMDFSIDTYHRVVNHLVCLGDGELKDRVVRHLYADGQGRVSTTQTFFGVDEIEAVYDYNNADAEELVERGAEHLLSMQSEGSVDVGTVDGGISAYVGDYIVARDNRNNAMVTAEVVQKIVKIQNGVMTVDYGVGSESNPMSRTIGGTAESTNSAAVYSAGQGISIVNNTISADVTQAELDSVSGVASSAASRANSAYTLAESKSDFSGSYNDLTDKPTIPDAVTNSTVTGWGFIKGTSSNAMTAKAITAGTSSFDTITAEGTYYVTTANANSFANSPVKAYGLLMVSYGSDVAGNICQIYVSNGTIYTRIKTSGGWGSWTNIRSFTETDPTVPAWAKAASKPTYTASEVGALPSSTVIPPEVTDATVSGWGYIKGYTETDPVFVASPAHGITSANITSWNGKSKVSASQSLSAGTEIGSITIDGTETKLYAPEGSSGGTSYTELWTGNATANTSVTLKSDIQNYDAVEFTFTDGARTWTELVSNKKSNTVTTSVSGSFRSGVTDFTSTSFAEYIVNMHIAITGKSLKVNSTGRMYIRYNAVPICDEVNSSSIKLTGVVGVNRSFSN